MTKPLKADSPHLAENRPQRPAARRWLVLVLAFLALGAVLLFLSFAEDTVDATRVSEPPPLATVSVETVTVGPQSAEVSAFAEIRPRWSAQLRAAVPGRIDQVFDSALAGERVAAGTRLMTIEDSPYAAELADAELALKQAQLALWKAENATTLARREFQRTNAEPPNDLALRLPELEIARSSVASAKARLAAARQRLDDTTVTAPFSGFVADRFISPGQSVSAGEPLVKLIDDSVYEITVELGARDWALLQHPLRGSYARIVDPQGKTIAEARIRQAGGFLDETTRQYKAFLEVGAAGSDAVLPGDFVRIILPGRQIEAALSIPASALTQEGHVWFLDAENRLQRITPQVLFHRLDRIVIEPPGPGKRWRIAVTPMLSFLPGQAASPNDEGG